MALSRKTYVAVAEVIEGVREEATKNGGKCPAVLTCDEIARGLADYFAGDNPRFDRSRFLTACGVE